VRVRGAGGLREEIAHDRAAGARLERPAIGRNRWSAVTPPPAESAGETSWQDFAREIFRLEGLTPR
jgi:hypothetical protein